MPLGAGLPALGGHGDTDRPGPFHNHKTFLATPNCILYRESFASRVRVRVLSPEGMLACAIAVKPGSYTTYCNRPLHERGVPASLPGAAEAVLDAGQRHIMVLLRLSLLRRLLAAEQIAFVLERTILNFCFRLSAASACRLPFDLYQGAQENTRDQSSFMDTTTQLFSGARSSA